MPAPTEQKQVLFNRGFRMAILGLFAFVGIFASGLTLTEQKTDAAVASTINYQARLETAAGAIVADGNYNVTFHLFNSATAVGGTSTDTGCGTDTSCLWEETYSYNSGPGSSDVRVRVVNGYLTVNLGTITGFGTLNWNQQMWLTMDIGGTTSSGVITWDGQMSPRIALTALPYAFQAGELGNGTNRATFDSSGNLQFQQASTIKELSAGTGTALTIQGGAATTGTNVGGNLILQGGAGASTGASGTVLVKSNTNNSTTAFQIQNASSTPVLTVDTTNQTLTVRAGSDHLTMGSNIYSTNFSTWTSAGWTIGGGNTTATHNTGNMTSLIDNTTTIVSGNTYEVLFNIASGTCSGTNQSQYVDVYIGGTYANTVYGNECGTTEDFIAQAGSSTGLTFSPSLNFVGQISGIVINQLTGTVNPVITVQNASAATSLEVRSSNVTSNIFIGNNSGRYSTSGSRSTSLGASSLQDTIGGDDNTAIGYGALKYNTNGWENTALGSQALYSNTAGQINVAVGYQALQNNTTGNQNVAIQGLGNNVNGSDNISVGNALNANISGSNNIGIGIGAYGKNTTGSYNTGLGYFAGYQDSGGNFLGVTNLQNATAIGAYAQVQASNSIVLGSIDTATKVGIGTTIPDNTFSVSPLFYGSSTNGAQSTNTLTDASVNFTTIGVKVGMRVIYANGTDGGTVTAVGTTTLTLSTSQTVSAQRYRIHYGGFQVTSSANVYTQNTSSTAFQIQDASSNALLTADTSNMRLGVNVTYAAMSVPSSLVCNATCPAAGGSVPTGTFKYEVTAVDSAGGETTVSNEITVTFTAGNQTANLSWTGSTGATGYRVYRTLSGGATGTEKFLANVTGTSYTDGVAANTVAAIAPPSTTTAYVSTNVSSSKLQLSIGGNGTPTGQLYVSGTLPSYVGYAPLTSTSLGLNVAVQGRYAYALSGTSPANFQVIDISNPASPKSVGTVSVASSRLESVAVNGRYAYAVDSTNGKLLVFDVSNPSSPSNVGSVFTGIHATPANGTQPINVYVQGRYAYVANYNSNQMVIIDVFNPSSPTHVATVSAGTNPNSVFVAGRYAYVVNQGTNTLQIFDVSNPASPSSVSTTATSSSAPYSVYVQGRYAYVTEQTTAKLQIFDVSNPSSPSSVGTAAISGSAYTQVVVQGRYAYTIGSGTMQVFDVSNPAAPTSIGAPSTTGNSNTAEAIDGRYAYLINKDVNSGAYQLEVYDLGGAYTQQLEAGGLETGSLNVRTNSNIAGDEAIQGGLQVGGAVDFGGNLAVGGASYLQGTLSVAGGVLGGAIINGLSTPSAPTVTALGTTGSTTYSYAITAISASGGETPASSNGSTGSGNATLSAGNFNRISWSSVTGAATYKIYRTVGGASQGLIGTTNSTRFDDTGLAASGSAPTLDTSGKLTVNGYATFKNTVNSTTAFQIQKADASVLLNADTTNMRISVGSIGTATSQFYVSGAVPTDLTSGGATVGGLGYDEVIQGRYVYVTSAANKIQVFDVSNPASPTDVSGGGVATATQPVALSVQGHYAYILGFSGAKLQVFDISKPSAPVDVSSGGVTTVAQPTELYVQGRYAYIVGSSSAKLQIFDISNPALPVDVSGGGVSTGAAPDTIYVQGRYAYIGTGSGSNKLQVFDVSNPASPTDVSSGGVASAGTYVANVYVQGRYAYVVTGGANSKIQVFNVANPASPASVGSTSTNGDSRYIYVQDRYAYVSSFANDNLQVFDVSTPASPTDVSGGGVSAAADPEVVVQGRYAYVLATNNTKLQVFDLGGSYIQQLEAGGAEVGTLAVNGNASINGDQSIQGGLQVGQSLQVTGNIGSSGSVLFQNSSNSATAFQVQDASGSNVLKVGTANLGSITTTSSMTATEQHASAIANGYAYVIGGTTTGAPAGGVSTVQYAKINADGTIGAWANNTNSLPAARSYGSQTAPVWNGYIYYGGGYNTNVSATAQSTVYYAKLNSDGTVGTWNATTSLATGGPGAMAEGAMVAANGYLYWLGGYNGTADVATSYYAKINADGTIGSWASTGITFPSNLADFQAVVSNGYIYTAGGWTGAGGTNDIFTAKLNSNGTLTGTAGNWYTPSTVSGNSLPGGGLIDASVAVANGQLYVIGGATGGAGPGTTAIYAFPLPADGSATMGNRATLSGTLGGNRWKGSAGSANGYIYYFGGDSGTGATASGNVYYGSTARVSIAGDLDLLGLTNGVLGGQSDGGGGNIYAGSIYSAGNLSVQGNVVLQNGLSVTGPLSFKDNANSTNALQLQNASGDALFNIDTTTSNLISNSTFEQNTTGWAATGTGASITQNTTASNSFNGTKSLQVTTGTTANSGARVSTFSTTLTPGSYSLIFYAKASTGFSDLAVTATGGSVTCTLNSNTVSTSGFQRYFCSFTSATTNITNITIGESGTTSHVFYLDAVQLVTGSTVTPYQNGALQLGGVINTALMVQPAAASTEALVVQNTSSNKLFAVDTLNSQVVLGQTGSSGVNGQLVFNSATANGYTATLVASGSQTASYTLTLPTAGPGTSQCLQSDSVTASQLKFGSCSAGSGGVSLQGSSPGSPDTGNFNVSGNGQVGGKFGIGFTGAAPTAALDVLAPTSTVGLNLTGTALASAGAANGANASTILNVLGATGQASSGSANTAGAGGAISLQGGGGGDNSSASGSPIAGAGGGITLQGGLGGANTGVSTGGTSGAGGSISILAGAGGIDGGSTGAGGNGGSINITAGDAGSGAGSSGTPGNVTIQAGQDSTNGLTGMVAVRSNTQNSQLAFQVQNASSIALFNVDTTTSNYISNSSFEANNTGWTATGTGASLGTAFATNSFNGIRSLQVTTGTTANSGAQVSTFTNSVSPGTYTLSFYAKASSAFSDLTAVFTGGSVTCTLNSNSVITAGFQRYSCSFTSSGSNITAITIGESGTTSHVFYLDAVQLLGGNTQAPYQLGAIGIYGVVTNALVVQPAAASTTAFQVLDTTNLSLLTVDTTNDLVQIGSATADTTAQLLVLDKYNSATEPTEVDGAIYYNSTMQQFRCGRDSVWEDCGINPIDRGYQFEDEFVSGTTTTGQVGALGWTLSSGGTSTLTYNTTMVPTANRPGVFGIQTGATSGNGSTIWLGGNATTGTMVLNNTVVIKAAIAIGATATNVITRVGALTETTTSASGSDGVWIETDGGAATNNWRYCYGTGAAATCANASTANGFASNHTVAASTWVRIEVDVLSSTSARYCIDGDCVTKTGLTIGQTNRENPAFACFNNTAAARNCYIDYYQIRGVASAAR